MSRAGHECTADIGTSTETMEGPVPGPSISSSVSNAPTTTDANSSRKDVLARLDELRDLIDKSSAAYHVLPRFVSNW